MQNDPIVSKSAELMRLELMPSASEIRAGKVIALSLFGSALPLNNLNRTRFKLIFRVPKARTLREAIERTVLLLACMNMKYKS
jgi:hypothetical protein